jgi:aryl-alcohol dehydrogenase-like predicted oxidoreductase
MSTFALGQTQVRRSGYGAMQLAGPYAFGPPPDRATAIGVLRAAVAAGVDHIDTARYYGSGVVNGLIRDALWPYPDGLAIVSKVAIRSDGGGAVLRSGDPEPSAPRHPGQPAQLAGRPARRGEHCTARCAAARRSPRSISQGVA